MDGRGFGVRVSGFGLRGSGCASCHTASVCMTEAQTHDSSFPQTLPSASSSKPIPKEEEGIKDLSWSGWRRSNASTQKYTRAHAHTRHTRTHKCVRVCCASPDRASSTKQRACLMRRCEHARCVAARIRASGVEHQAASMLDASSNASTRASSRCGLTSISHNLVPDR